MSRISSASTAVSASSCASKCYYILHVAAVFRRNSLRNGSRKRQGGSIIGTGVFRLFWVAEKLNLPKISLKPQVSTYRRQEELPVGICYTEVVRDASGACVSGRRCISAEVDMGQAGSNKGTPIATADSSD
ncbi:hypothetical protein BDW71DRAFT_174660 [Aspergillus fruticulosus]